MIIDPAGCAGYIVDIHGAAGVEWLERLPAIIADCAARWSLTVLPPFEDLSYNYVTPAQQADGTPVVLKAGVPGSEFLTEMHALRAFNGEGMARLLAADPEQGVLLLERLMPGTALSQAADDVQVTLAAASVMQQLWRPASTPHPFVTLAQWARGLHKLRAHFGGGYGPFPPALVDKAQGLFAELLSAENGQVLLHGDLHPQNILRSERQPWLAIDPKGVVGDRLYDVATFVSSVNAGGANVQAMVEQRINLLADLLGFERAQLMKWALAQAVLSGWWSYEDHGRGWEWAFSLAGIYASLMK
jgi:streptomycin 6-kinase